MNDSTSDFHWDHDPLLYHKCGLTGYTGLDPHTILQTSVLPASRIQIGPRGLYKGTLAVLPDGDLIVTPTDQRKEGWPIHIFKSSDKGRTWKQIEHTPLFGKEACLTSFPDGSLLLSVESQQGRVYHSEDAGQTWQATDMRTMLPPLSDTGWFYVVRSPIENPDGTISMLRSWGHWEGSPKDSPRSRVWLFHSSDFGRTWSDVEEIQTWDDSFPQFAEADFLRLPDGRILATSRFEFDHPITGTKPPWPPKSVPNDHAAGHMVLLESSDEGRSWSKPRDFLNYSEVQGQLTLLQDGRILCTYTNYHLPFGIAAVLSEDLGKTWDTSHPMILGMSNGICTGWPTTRQLEDGTLLTVYALEPYHLTPSVQERTVFQCLRWNAPR